MNRYLKHHKRYYNTAAEAAIKVVDSCAVLYKCYKEAFSNEGREDGIAS